MLPCYEPIDPDTLLIGMQWVRTSGAWPLLRHVYECDDEAGLVIDIDPLASVQAYAVSYTHDSEGTQESLHPL